MKCPKCKSECEREEVDVGVGIIYGPYGCPSCAWSDDEEYNLSDGKSNLRENGIIDQYGGLTPFKRK